MTETQIKIIEAAELEFAKSGFSGASVRDITSVAGVNIAAINYHFGNKEKLFCEMVRYRLEPINQLRIDLLDREYQKSGGTALPLKRIIEIIVRPLLENLMNDHSNDFLFMKAMGKGFGEDRDFMKSIQEGILKETVERFAKAIAHTLGTEDKRMIGYSIHLMSSAIGGIMMQHKRLESSSQGAAKRSDVEGLITHTIAFITGGIQSIKNMDKQ